MELDHQVAPEGKLVWVKVGSGWAARGYSAAEIDAADRGVGWLLHEGASPVRLRACYLQDSDLEALIPRAEAIRRAAFRGVGAVRAVSSVRSTVRAALTPQEQSGRPAVAGARAPEQLAFSIPPVQVELSEFVRMGGFRLVHAVPWIPATAKRLGLSGWPTRAFCGKPVRESDIGGGTRDPSDIGCRACLRAMRLAGVL